MARGSHGYTLKRKAGRTVWQVVFWDSEAHRQVERSTGESDPDRAHIRAARVVAHYNSQKPKERRRPCAQPPLALDPLATEWLRSLKGVIDDGTRASYALTFKAHLAPRWPSLLDVTTPGVRQYIAERLQVVQGVTVRKELSPLRGLFEWCVEQGRISEDEAPRIPGVPKRAIGTTYEKPRRRKPPELSVSEVQRLIRALPIYVDGIGHVRDRFFIQYAMGLRSSTMDKLSMPDNYRAGSRRLTLDAADVKDRTEQDRLIPRAALAAFKRVTRGMASGVIFGEHRYEELIYEAAQRVWGEGSDKAEVFAATHLRSAAITHFIDRGAPLTAAAKFAGHKLLTTTDRYARPSTRALEAEMKRQGLV